MDARGQIEACAAERLGLIPASFHRLTGKILAGGHDLWSAPLAVVAHGTEPSPRFFYANRLALDLFRMAPEQLIGLESRLSAGPADRAERAAMFARLETADFVQDYRGVRVAGDGTRFTIENAAIWNLVDELGSRHGQAAAFAEWQLLG